MICFISSSNPISRIRSASSMMRQWRFLYTNPGVFWRRRQRDREGGREGERGREREREGEGEGERGREREGEGGRG